MPPGVGLTTEIYAAQASGSELTDESGRRYIDFAGGIGVLNVGHRHPRVEAAIVEQARRFTHTCYQVVPYASYVTLAERLNARVPGDFAKKTVFFSTGAEAVENAVKIARASTGRTAIIGFTGAFHGRTMMGLALTGKVAPYKTGFGPFPGTSTACRSRAPTRPRRWAVPWPRSRTCCATTSRLPAWPPS